MSMKTEHSRGNPVLFVILCAELQAIEFNTQKVSSGVTVNYCKNLERIRQQVREEGSLAVLWFKFPVATPPTGTDWTAGPHLGGALLSTSDTVKTAMGGHPPPFTKSLQGPRCLTTALPTRKGEQTCSMPPLFLAFFKQKLEKTGTLSLMEVKQQKDLFPNKNGKQGYFRCWKSSKNQ